MLSSKHKSHKAGNVNLWYVFYESIINCVYTISGILTPENTQLMFGFVRVFTFYIEFRGEISPFIFKLAGKQQLSVKIKDSAAQRTVLPPNFGESKFIPSQVFYSPPSYLLRQDLFKFLRFWEYMHFFIMLYISSGIYLEEIPSINCPLLILWWYIFSLILRFDQCPIVSKWDWDLGKFKLKIQKYILINIPVLPNKI